MEYSFAPLEGLTDSTYRRLHHQFFGGIDRYYTPFFSPTMHHNLSPRELRELPLADSMNYTVIPQVLTKSAEDFVWFAQQCQERGYREINLNLGCPSGTVTAKGKGSGMLRDPAALDAFLENIFRDTALPVSIKTRIGFESPGEFGPLIEIFNRYPLSRLIVHPRVRCVFYNGPVEMHAFQTAVKKSTCPVSYNGNLNSLCDIASFRTDFPQVQELMLGRGLIGDPGMLTPGGTQRKALQAFHDALLDAYLVEFGGSRNAMFRMKENWRYMLCKFEHSEKLGKKLRKTTDLQEYKQLVHEIFDTLPMSPNLYANW